MVKTLVLVLGIFLGEKSFAGEVIQVKVKGMVCSFCSQGITKKFKAEPAVKNVLVTLEDHLVKLELKDGESLDDQKIETVLKEAGYSVEKIEHK